MEDNNPPPASALEGSRDVPVPSQIALRIVKMLCPVNSDEQTIAEAFKVDDVLQMPAIQKALAMMRTKVDHEAEQRRHAEQMMHRAETLLREGSEKYTQLKNLVSALDDYIAHLHDAEKSCVLPFFLKHNTEQAMLYTTEILDKGKELRRKIATLTPRDLVEPVPGVGEDGPPAERKE